MSRPLAGWRLPLRLAWREARRARGRSVLVLVMIALPVLGVTLTDTVYATSQVSGAEGVDRRLGTAEARIDLGDGGHVVQGFDPDGGYGFYRRGRGPGADLDDVGAVLGGQRPTVPLAEGSVRFRTERGIGRAEVTETDLDDPLTSGLVELTSGRLPGAGEAVVNADLAARGPGVGGQLELSDGSSLDIVGIAESTAARGYPQAFAPPGSFGLRSSGAGTYLVGGAPVSWDQVRELNALGVTVASRAVISNPPPDSELPAATQQTGGVDPAFVTVLVLVVVMVLIEVVLLAGPAFAVGARREARTLALIAACGGSPRDARRVVLGAGVVLGVLGALLGVGLGILGAWALEPLFQHYSDARFGPFDVTWLHLAGVAAFGALSALLAAAVPAWVASRQDVVAVLAGRRGDRQPSRRSPVLGLVLLAAGVGGAVWGVRSPSQGETLIAGSAIVSVLGMVLVVPLVVVVVARGARRLPLALRFAARDAARHRTRTVPAVAAVAATVAGVVALGIAVASDEAQNAGEYTARMPLGEGYVRQDVLRATAPAPDWAALRSTLERELPGAQVEALQGVLTNAPRGDYVDVSLRVPGGRPLLSGYYDGPGGPVLVADSLPAGLTGVADLTDEQRSAAEDALREGGAVGFADRGVASGEADLVVRTDGRGADTRERHRLPVVTIPVEPLAANTTMVLSPQAAREAGLPTTTTGLVFRGTFDEAGEQDAAEAVAALPGPASFYVEHGFQADDETVIVQLVLGALGAVLMLGGTLTATFLALSDARPDLATLGAVGASPRTRRGVAAAYALVVGVVGAVLGTLVGLVPGIAITYPLTRPYDGFGGPAHYLDVPWLLVLGVVLGLPLLTSALVGLAARSRLPLVARLD